MGERRGPQLRPRRPGRQDPGRACPLVRTGRGQQEHRLRHRLEGHWHLRSGVERLRGRVAPYGRVVRRFRCWLERAPRRRRRRGSERLVRGRALGAPDRAGGGVRLRAFGRAEREQWRCRQLHRQRPAADRRLRHARTRRRARARRRWRPTAGPSAPTVRPRAAACCWPTRTSRGRGSAGSGRLTSRSRASSTSTAPSFPVCRASASASPRSSAGPIPCRRATASPPTASGWCPARPPRTCTATGSAR